MQLWIKLILGLPSPNFVLFSSWIILSHKQHGDPYLQVPFPPFIVIYFMYFHLKIHLPSFVPFLFVMLHDHLSISTPSNLSNYKPSSSTSFPTSSTPQISSKQAYNMIHQPQYQYNYPAFTTLPVIFSNWFKLFMFS